MEFVFRFSFDIILLKIPMLEEINWMIDLRSMSLGYLMQVDFLGIILYGFSFVCRIWERC